MLLKRDAVIKTAWRGEPKHMLVHDVSWPDYTAQLKALDDRRVRLTYDHGTLEAMPLSPKHERTKVVLRRLVDVLGEELEIEVCGLGSTTCRKRELSRGLEPDECYYLRRIFRLKGKKRLNLKKDPPPDLALEVDITHSSLDRLAIYADLGVPEVWRFDGAAVRIYCLTHGAYEEADRSQAFPMVSVKDLGRFVKLGLKRGENTMVREFRAWLRGQTKRNGARKRGTP